MKLIPSPFHRKVNLIFGFLLLIITSCQEYEPNPEQLDIQENDLNYVDISQAELIASTIEFPTVQSKSTSQKSNREEFDVKILGSKTISESKSSIGKNNKAVFHLINYEEGGFVILSADKSLPPILAFSLDNPMPFLSEKEYPEGLSDWFSNQKDLVEVIREDPSAEVLLGENIISEFGSNFWDPCAIQRQITGENKSTDPCDPNGGGCEDQYTQVAPLLTTQ